MIATDKPTKINILVTSANLGNQQPDQESLDLWIPNDGCVADVVDNPRYPVQSMTKKRILKALQQTVPNETFSNLLNKYNSTNSNENTNLNSPTQSNGQNQSHNLNGTDNGGTDTKKFDIVVVGMQEATFKVESYGDQQKRKNTFPLPLLPTAAKAQKAVTDLTKTKNHLEMAKKQQQEQKNSSSAIFAENSPESPPSSFNKGKYPSSNNGLGNNSEHSTLENSTPRMASSGRPKELHDVDDTYVLHDMLQTRLPSYEQAISFQRGQMRLMLFYCPEQISLDVISVKAQNTGKGGLANKGGIVTEVNVNKTTRIAFSTAHLEAHEGLEKYKTRCSTVADIFRGTTSNVTQCRCDASLASHFMFAMGDLNFRTRLPEYPPGSPEHIQATLALVEKQDWETIYKHDELLSAMAHKHCFSGFYTPVCSFPPTFKVQRQQGYAYNEKRSPSYTDRILYLAGHRLRSKLKVLSYEPIDDFQSSDHKPIRGAFEVELNPSLIWEPTLSTTHREGATPPRKKRRFRGKKKLGRSSFRLPSQQDPLDQPEYLHLYVSSIHVQIDKEKYKNADNTTPSPFVCFVSTPAEAIKMKTRYWKKLKRMLSRTTTTKNLKNSGGSREWPRTRQRKHTYEADWNDEEVHFQVRTHYNDGKPIDLSGAMIHVAVYDGKTSGKLLGTVSLNLASLIVQSRQELEENKKKTLDEVVLDALAARRARRGSIVGSMMNLFQRYGGSRMDVRQSDSNDSPMVESKFDRIEKNENSSALESTSQMDVVLEDEELKDAEHGIVFPGPSESLIRATSQVWIRRKSSLNSLSRNSSLDSMNIQSTRMEEPLRKHGVEVGKIQLTIDSWWLDDENGHERMGRI